MWDQKHMHSIGQESRCDMIFDGSDLRQFKWWLYRWLRDSENIQLLQRIKVQFLALTSGSPQWLVALATEDNYLWPPKTSVLMCTPLHINTFIHRI